MSEKTATVFKTHRNNSKINPEILLREILSNETRTQQYKEIQKKFQAIDQTPEIYEMSREELTSFAFRVGQELKMQLPVINHNNQSIPEELHPSINFHPAGSIGLLIPASLIDTMATEEQKAAWLPSITKHVYMCCYAQTELGTGSDVQNLKTVAVFDEKTQEFVINTPSVDAIKWWPGDLGVWSSHCLLMAQLYSGGKCYGVQAFFFPIRNWKTHEILPGAEMGDIGPKLGFNTKDNGFIRY